ncbi:MAG TPA: hypothetical protein VF126_17075 [Acidobacteriaceae bacterium]
MTIDVRIERLVLDGLPSMADTHAVRGALGRELTRLLQTGGLSDELRTGGALPHLRGDAIHVQPAALPQRFGEQVAGSVHGAIGGCGTPRAREKGRY